MKALLMALTMALSFNTIAETITSVPPSFGKMGLSKKVLGLYPRDQVKDSSDFPFRVIGQIQVGCTGTLIGPKHILTAGHCVYDIETQSWSEDLDFYPGRLSESQMPYGAVTWKKVFVQKEYLETGSTAYDFAVIELAEPIGEQVGWSGFKALPESEYSNKVRITGYPGDKETGTMWTVSCPSNVIDTTINYECDTYGGMSGSGIFSLNTDPEKTYLTSVHTFGSSDSNGGVIIDRKNFGMILSWRNGENISDNTITHEKLIRTTQNYDKFFFKNNCHLPIRVYLFWKDLDDEWLPGGPWTLAPGERAYVADTRNRVYYFAGLSNRAEYVWKGEHEIPMKDGSTFMMIRGEITTDSWGEWTQQFSCD